MDSIRSNPSNGIDRISNLGDSILGKILSHLPTKNAVATSILSTRWRNLFPAAVSLTQIDLRDNRIIDRERHINLYGAPSPTFIDFVNKLLNETLRQETVETVVFDSRNKYDDGQIASWISSARRLNFRRLELHLMYAKESKELFEALNGISSMEELGITCHRKLYVPEDFSLPNLKRLRLFDLLLLDCSDSISALLKGCPSLEDLSFIRCSFEYLDVLRIQSHLLKRFCIEGFEANCGVVIDAPNLEVFAYEGFRLPQFDAKKFEALLECCIDFSEPMFYDVYDSMEDEDDEDDDDEDDVECCIDSYKLMFYDVFDSMEDGDDENDDDDYCFLDYRNDALAAVLHACKHTIRLYLSGLAMKALHISSVELPTFDKLTFLRLGFIGKQGWKVLAELLPKTCHLEWLILDEGFDNNYERGYAKFKSLLTSLPLCLKTLKKIELWKFRRHQDEFKFIEYFLMNGTALQEIEIYCLPCEDTTFFNR